MDNRTAPRRIEVARFPGNRRFAVTTSWDDGVIEDRRLIEWMNENGLRGTFNLNSATFKNAGHPSSEGRLDVSEVAALYRGHEVAVHTSTHPHLPLLDASQIALEVLDDRKMLEDLVGYPVRGMAYPFGTYSPKVIEILRALGIVYCRTVENADSCFPPREPLAWAATAHMFSDEGGGVGARFMQWRSSPWSPSVMFVWGHAYEFARPADRWGELDSRFRPLCGHDDTWYCTNLELFDYESARQRMVIAANKKTAFNPSALTLTLLVDGKPVDVGGGASANLC